MKALSRNEARRSWRPVLLALAAGAGALVLRPAWVEQTEPPFLSSGNAAQPVTLDLPTPPPPAPEIGATFEKSGRNPGSAAHPFSPGRVRPDAPAVFEGNHADPQVPDWARFLLVPRTAGRWPETDPRFHDVLRLSDDFRSDDFPAIATRPGEREETWMVWVSYAGRRDELRLARRDPETGQWGPWSPVPGVTGDVWRPSVAFDATGRLWVFWSQQEPWRQPASTPTAAASSYPNFDLYGRSFDGERWGRLERLSSAPEGDFGQRVVRGPDGTLHVAWQGFRHGQSDVFYRSFDGERWSQELRVSESDANDWAPDLAVDSRGRVYVVWDTYERGDYDVVGRTVRDGEGGNRFVVAATDFFEAAPSALVDEQDRLWVAYEVGEQGWGKDQGLLVDEERRPGSPLNLERLVQVRVRSASGWTAAEPPLETLFPPRPRLYYGETDNPSLSAPLLTRDARGRIHLLVRALVSAGGFAQNWHLRVLTMGEDGWGEPAPVPFSGGRLSMAASASPSAQGGLWLAWPRDGFPPFAAGVTLPEETIVENVYAGRWEPGSEAGARLGEPNDPPLPTRPAGHADEAADVARLRDWRVRVGGETLLLLRGDTHRHTELSPDMRGIPDGSVLDFYRYMLDAAAMDFGLISDHQYGADREYWWWLEEKLADLHHAPERYVSLFGYERSVQFPMGHRNVVHAERGHLPVRFFQKWKYDDFPGIRFHNSSPAVQADDTKLLWEAVAETGGITIPHTTATASGTDWSENDPRVETLVEIFQGDRYSYEASGAPLTDSASARGDRAGSATTRPQDAGFVSKAWDKGYRIGVIASSDHISTHISYAMVWTPERTRQAVLEAMKARRTYAATDNIVLELWLGEGFMGDDLGRQDETPTLRLAAVGTGAIASAEILRNNEVVYAARPGSREIEVDFEDLEPDPGTNFYYARLRQEDGHMAWSSPIWIEWPEPATSTNENGE